MTIYIRPDGTISGSNEPLPVRPKEEWTDSIHNYGGYVYGYGIAMKNYENALTAWKESCIDFESQVEIRKHLPDDAWGRDSFDLRYNPDTIIENVDVETEEIRQVKNPMSGEWERTEMRGSISLIRTVLRIKDKT